MTDTRPTAKQEWTTPAEIVRSMAIRQSLPKRWIESGELPAVNIGTPRRPNYRVRVADLDAFLARLAVVPEARPTRRARRSEVPSYV